MHPYDVWQGKTEAGIHIYQIRKRKDSKNEPQKKNKDCIVEFYNNNPTIEEVSEEWIERKLEYKEIQKGSADRYTTDFERFFIKTKFAEKR